MLPRPNFFLCFLGRALFIAVVGLWMYSIFHTKMFVPMIFGGQFFIQSFIGLSKQKQRWSDRSKPTNDKSAWIIAGGIGVGLLFASAILGYFFLLKSPQITELALFLLPIAVVVGYYLDEWGIERPLRQWHENQAKPMTFITPSTTVQATPTQQRVGRP
jgi:hypothetical protein